MLVLGDSVLRLQALLKLKASLIMAMRFCRSSSDMWLSLRLSLKGQPPPLKRLYIDVLYLYH